MITIKTSFREFPVYEELEAKEYGLEYYSNDDLVKLCMEGKQNEVVGKWYLTEDRYIVALRKVYTSRSRQIVNAKYKVPYTIYKFCTSIGTFNIKCVHAKTGDAWYAFDINFSEHHAARIYYGDNLKPWGERMLKKTKVRRTLLAHAYLLANNKFNKEAEMNLALYLYNKGQRKPLAAYRRLLKQTEVKEFVENEFKLQLVGSGVTEQYLAVTLYEAIELAKSKKNADAMIRGVALGAKLSGLEPSQNKTVLTTTQQLTVKDAKELANTIAEAKLTMKKETKEITSGTTITDS